MKSYKTKEEMEQLLIRTGFTTVHFNEDTTKKWISIKGIKR